MKKFITLFCCAVFICVSSNTFASSGDFDFDRWDELQNSLRIAATQDNISKTTINSTLNNLNFVPKIVYRDKNQSEFKLTMKDYLSRTVNPERIKTGHSMSKKYPTLLGKTYNKYGVPSNVILAFWGMESNYGSVKKEYKLKDSFFTLMYDGRREKFFTKQLLSLMKTADKNKQDINDIYGSWAGAMGHFQFIPTTLAQYGIDGNGDGKIDVINNISDAMFSAGHYLNQLGWDSHGKIARKVFIPVDFDTDLLNGDTKYTMSKWSNYGVLNTDGTPLEVSETVVGLVADVNDTTELSMTMAQGDDIKSKYVKIAYITYPNFYRIKRWNNSNWYAIAISELADKLR